MRLKSVILATALAASLPCWNSASAQDIAFARLDNIEEAEALEMLSRLAQFQQWMREGRRSSVELMAGGAASGVGAGQSARDTLLGLPLDKALFAEKLSSTIDGRMRYRFSVMPDGLGRPYWQVDMLMLGSTIVRIDMLNRIPAPF